MFGMKRELEPLSEIGGLSIGRIEKRGRPNSDLDFPSTPQSCSCQRDVFNEECLYCCNLRVQNERQSNELVHHFKSLQSPTKRSRSWELEIETFSDTDERSSHDSKRPHSSDVDLNRVRLPDVPDSISFPAPLPSESNSNVDYSSSNYSLKQLHLERLNRRIALYSNIRQAEAEEEDGNDML